MDQTLHLAQQKKGLRKPERERIIPSLRRRLQREQIQARRVAGAWAAAGNSDRTAINPGDANFARARNRPRGRTWGSWQLEMGTFSTFVPPEKYSFPPPLVAGCARAGAAMVRSQRTLAPKKFPNVAQSRYMGMSLSSKSSKVRDYRRRFVPSAQRSGQGPGNAKKRHKRYVRAQMRLARLNGVVPFANDCTGSSGNGIYRDRSSTPPTEAVGGRGSSREEHYSNQRSPLYNPGAARACFDADSAYASYGTLWEAAEQFTEQDEEEPEDEEDDDLDDAEEEDIEKDYVEEYNHFFPSELSSSDEDDEGQAPTSSAGATTTNLSLLTAMRI